VGTSLAYDQQLNLLTVRDELNRPVEAYTLDGLDRITNVFNLATQSMVHLLRRGRPRQQRGTRYDGSVITNAYDGGGRLASTKYLPAGGSPSGRDQRLHLDGGRADAAASGVGGTVSNRYDFMGRLASSRTSGSSRRRA
jgi:hypothetical protein